MFKSLIKAIEKLASEQKESNKINREYIAYRIKTELEAKELSEEIRKQNQENELKARELNEELVEIANGRMQEALDRNTRALINYFEGRLKEVTDKE